MNINTLLESARATLLVAAWKVIGAAVLWLIGRWLMMAAFGGRRWPGPPMRLVAGQMNTATMMISGRGFEMMGAYRPVWSADGKQIAYRFGESVGVWLVSGQGEPGAGSIEPSYVRHSSRSAGRVLLGLALWPCRPWLPGS